jgi:hypothetical protein
MYNFCTLFDSFYLSRGLTMYDSLKHQIGEFHLYIFPFDELSFRILNELNLDNVTLVNQKKFETIELLEVKKKRSKAEYCWTCTSSIIAYVLDNYNVRDCTYIDADLFFYNSPAILLKELTGGKTVLITEHRYSLISRLYDEKRAGKYCVQFITFTNDQESKIILKTWINQCIDWCYARYEEGKFGDQKYLDLWPDLYNSVLVSKHPGGGVAPWNVNQYRITKNEDLLSGIERKSGKKFEIIFYHFHFVRFMDCGYIDLGWNRIPVDIQSIIYVPYIMKLRETELLLRNSFIDYQTKYYQSKPSGIKNSIKYFIKRITKFNLVKV